jgi:hypothetical protein
MVPYSNPGGNNQNTPPGLNQGNGSGGVMPVAVGAVPTSNPLNPAAPLQSNPLIPATATTVGGTPTNVLPPAVAAPTPNNGVNQATNVAPIVPGGVASNNLDTQLTDIYGQGVGASLFNLVNNMSGSNSASLQEYEASLQPQEAAADANLKASLGAGGVSANSSVAALGEANLQAQETGMIAGEESTLTQNQEQLEAQILEGTEGAATKEVSESGWNVLGSVLEGVGNVASDFIDPAGISFGKSSSVPTGSPASTSSSFTDDAGGLY